MKYFTKILMLILLIFITVEGYGQIKNDSLTIRGDTAMFYNEKQIDFGMAFHIIETSAYPKSYLEIKSARKNRRWKYFMLSIGLVGPALDALVALSDKKEPDRKPDWTYIGISAGVGLISFTIFLSAQEKHKRRAFDYYNAHQ